MHIFFSHFFPHHNITNLLHYVTVRASCALLTSLLLTLLVGSWFIAFSKKHFMVPVRCLTPDRHQQEKKNTPGMGGLYFIGMIIITACCWSDVTQPIVWIALGCLLSFATLGFLDDYCKLRYREGIAAWAKFIGQLVCAGLVVTLWYWLHAPNTQLCFPFFKNLQPELGLFIIPWGMLILVSTSNAVNLTDGLDGLATGSLISTISAYTLILYVAGHGEFAHYLYIPWAGTAELVVVAMSVVGALIGFLWYNTYPAQVFMGDVGSLALGAMLGFFALCARQELLLLVAGGIFIVETLSVIIQVLCYKMTGKRAFRMAPIHHHFELLGWDESKIAVRFWIISMILSIVALLTLKIR